jgi:hypothetical protein
VHHLPPNTIYATKLQIPHLEQREVEMRIAKTPALALAYAPVQRSGIMDPVRKREDLDSVV